MKNTTIRDSYIEKYEMERDRDKERDIKERGKEETIIIGPKDWEGERNREGENERRDAHKEKEGKREEINIAIKRRPLEFSFIEVQFSQTTAIMTGPSQ